MAGVVSIIRAWATGRRRLALVLAIGQLAGRGSLAVYLLILVRRLPQVEFGGFAYALGIAGILVVLADGGVGRLITRDVARSPEPGRSLRRLLLLRGAAVVVTALVGLVIVESRLLPFGSRFGLLLVAYVATEGLATGFEAAGTGAQRAALVATALGGSGLVLLLGAAVLAARAPSPELAMAGLVAASAVRLAIHVAAWAPGLNRAGDRGFSVQKARTVWAEALPLFLFSALAVLYYRLDIVILHAVAGPGETAVYAAAYRLVDAASVIGLVTFSVLAPHFSRLQASDPATVWSEWRHFVVRLAKIGAPAGLLLMAGAGPVVSLLFGARYDAAASVLRLLVPGMLFMVLATLNGAVLLMGNAPGKVLLLTVGSLAINIALTTAGARAFGADGAAAATSASELASFALVAAVLTGDHRRQKAVPGHWPAA